VRVELAKCGEEVDVCLYRDTQRNPKNRKRYDELGVQLRLFIKVGRRMGTHADEQRLVDVLRGVVGTVRRRFSRKLSQILTIR
jgi:hypothetical protein